MHDTHDHKNTYVYQGHTYTHKMQDTYGGVAGDGLPIFARGAFTYERATPARFACIRSKETSAASGIFCVLFLTECNKVKFKQMARVSFVLHKYIK